MTSATKPSQSSAIVSEPMQPAASVRKPAEIARPGADKGNGKPVIQPITGPASLFANVYETRSSPACHAYLAAHPEVADFLQSSYGQLGRFFGPETSFVLEVVRDPEALAPSDFLFVNIRTALPVDDAMARLDQFDDTWYLDQVDTFGELVNFNLEFYEL